MIKRLNTIVKRIIIPQHPWIKDFVWTSNYFGGSRYYSLELMVEKNFYSNNPDTEHIYHKLFNDCKMLFKMTGPDDNEFFDDVTISPEDYTIDW